MEKLTICIFLITFFISQCGSIYEIVRDGPAWLGENLTLTVNIPFIQRPIVWKSLNYKYECDRICANGADYRVTHTGNRSTLWIRKVSRKFSRWQVQDDYGEGGKLELQIKVKPKIEINNTDCDYRVQAVDSFPLTSIECFDGNKPLEFTNISQSNSSDGRTCSNIATLSFSDFGGIVTCSFTIGEIFKENRRFQVECKDSTPVNCTLIIVIVVLFQLLLILGCFLFWKMRKQITSLKRIKGDDIRSIKCIAFIVAGQLLAVLIEIFTITLLVICLMGRQMISHTIDIVLLVVFDVIFLAWITACFFLFKELRKRKINLRDGGGKWIKSSSVSQAESSVTFIRPEHNPESNTESKIQLDQPEFNPESYSESSVTFNLHEHNPVSNAESMIQLNQHQPEYNPESNAEFGIESDDPESTPVLHTERCIESHVPESILVTNAVSEDGKESDDPESFRISNAESEGGKEETENCRRPVEESEKELQESESILNSMITDLDSTVKVLDRILSSTQNPSG